MSRLHDELAFLDDERLVILAGQLPPAAHVLIARHHGWAKRHIARLALAHGLSAPDIEDAQQQTVIVLLQAIAYYRNSPRVPHGSFARFSRWFLRCRSANLIRGLCRCQRRYDRSAESMVTLAGGLANARHASLRDNPARLAEWGETLEALRTVPNHLDERERKLWQLLATGSELGQIAVVLRISRRTVGRRRGRLLNKVRDLLSGCGRSFRADSDSLLDKTRKEITDALPVRPRQS